MKQISKELFLLGLIVLGIVTILLVRSTEANKLTVGAKVENKLRVTSNTGTQDAISPQKTAGLDVLQYCAKDGLEWQVSCEALVR